MFCTKFLNILENINLKIIEETIEEIKYIFLLYNAVPTIQTSLTHRRHPLNIRLMLATILSGLRLPMESFARTIPPLKIKLIRIYI